jgi:hypothetical protein
MLRRRLFLSLLLLMALAVIPAGGAAASGGGGDRLSRIHHIVVIYQENHSFDNLYGMWEGVNGLRNAPRARTTQVNQAGTPYDCLLQNDVNLTSPPLSVRCTDTTTGTSFSSHFRRSTWPPGSWPPPAPARSWYRGPSGTWSGAPTSRWRTMEPTRSRAWATPGSSLPPAERGSTSGPLSSPRNSQSRVGVLAYQAIRT